MSANHIEFFSHFIVILHLKLMQLSDKWIKSKLRELVFYMASFPHRVSVRSYEWDENIDIWHRRSIVLCNVVKEQQHLFTYWQMMIELVWTKPNSQFPF